jgi:hypothetical protein
VTPDVKSLERQVATELAASFTNRPSEWRYADTSKDVLCGPNGVRVSANFFTVYQPQHLKFGFWNRRRIKGAIKAWRRQVGNSLALDDRRAALIQLRRCLAEALKVAA